MQNKEENKLKISVLGRFEVSIGGVPIPHLSDRKARFSGMLMTHNTRVTLTAVALGMSWGIGTLVLLFYNGVALGAVVASRSHCCAVYMRDSCI